ncbi:hypothetical protein PMI14_01397 [Acidovorax sp. CF316]|uniref:SMI1/KNR4 family protein n=1 Tax=Acidovorax sp. CF316 TaxID=1144317 RepID=UPI00026BCF03|nr:SMI1/KNR4 family protein [Acidovorax sp. CF316]EJE53708.1 hypothetical protein PMI14_01397 [Acidovorax sp. CF316]
MTTYTSHWHQAAADNAQGPLLIKITLLPHGYDGHAYWKRQEARASDREFRMVEDLRLDPEGGPQAVLQRLVDLRQALARQGWQEIVVHDSLTLFPKNLLDHRPKTGDECLMDLAALYTECSDHENALAALQRCRHSEQAWYWRTAARRAHANRARANPGPGADGDWAAAVEHAMFIIHQAADTDAAQPHAMYSFGDSYRHTASQLAAAAQTVAEYLLNIAGDPEQAMQALAIADATNHGTSQLQQLKVTALLQLDRSTEAYETHLKWRLQMPEVLESPGYRDFIERQQTQARDAQSQRISQLRFDFSTGTPASESELEQLLRHFQQPSHAYLQWISQAERHQLTVADGENEETYTLFSIPAALDKHEELLGWLALHDESSPELAEEIRSAIADSGIDPRHMLPIVGDANSSDCFLLRTQGPGAGGIYFWAHDECTVFSPIVDRADQLFPWLQAQARAGSTFVL